MSRYHTSPTPPITFVAGTSRSIIRSNPKRCGLIIPVPSGTTFTFSLNEVASTATDFTFAGATYPLIIKEEDWGDMVERALSGIMSNAITIVILEIIDTERKL